MGSKISNVDSLPRMIIREPTEVNNTVPGLPAMPPEYNYGGEWMDPQWKKDVRTAKRLFVKYPIQMAIILVLTAALAITLGLVTGSSKKSDDNILYDENTAFIDENNEYVTDTDIFMEEGSQTETTLDSDETIDESTAGVEEPANSEQSAPTGNTAGNIGNVYVEYTGYELTEDYQGIPAIKVYYKYTNKSDDAIAVHYFVLASFTQNGTPLNYTADKDYNYGTADYELVLYPDESTEDYMLLALVNTVDPVKAVFSDMTMLSSEIVEATIALN